MLLGVKMYKKICKVIYQIMFDLNRYFDVEKQHRINKQAIKRKNYYYLD